MSKTICFDFDGVLAAYDEWKDGEIGDPIPAGIELARLLDAKGYMIVVNTCRTHPMHGTRTEQYIAVTNWLYKHEVPFNWVEMDGKPVADVYIDDRGLRFNQKLGDLLEYADDLFWKIVNRLEP
jgi:hypothetical protein